MRRTVVSAALVLSLSVPGAVASADALTDRLEAIPGVTVVQERAHPDPSRRVFILSYAQQVNHLKPWKGTFEQRVVLIHRDETAPTVLITDGYNTSTGNALGQVTQIVDGNQVRIEHRFFMPSRPEPADWRDLDIFQAASDHHRIVSALKSIYRGRWLSTGASKSGMASVYYRTFYPFDMNGTVAYVAPNDVIDRRDRYVDFIDHVGDDPDCRAALEEVQREALLRRDEIVPMMLDLADFFGLTYDHVFGTPEKALEIMVLETPFTFWQYGAQDFCAFVPAADASTQEIFDFYDAFVGWTNYTDQVVGDVFAPYFYQAATQIGYPTVKESHLADLLLFPGSDVARSFLPPEIPVPRFDPIAMPVVDLFVKLLSRQMMFIYGEIDPWGAEPFHCGIGSRDCFEYVVAGGNHGSNIGQLPAAQADQAVAAIRRWAGLPALSAAARAASPASGLRATEIELERPRL